MLESFNFDRLFKEWIENAWIGYAQILGPPAYPDAETFDALVSGLRDFKQRHPDMAFWQIVSMKDLLSAASGGDVEVFGAPVRTYRDFLRLIHPDYLLPYLQWRNAAYGALVKMQIKMTPMEGSFRASLPMRTKDGAYHWFSQHTTIAQIDDGGRIVSILHTLYLEGKWTLHSTKPFVAFFQGPIPDAELEDMLRAQIVPYILDELTNGELDLIPCTPTNSPLKKSVAKKAGPNTRCTNITPVCSKKQSGCFNLNSEMPGISPHSASNGVSSTKETCESPKWGFAPLVIYAIFALSKHAAKRYYTSSISSFELLVTSVAGSFFIGELGFRISDLGLGF